MTEQVDAVVIGGGISGLSAALALTHAGRSVVLLEADHDVGGVIRTTLHEGFQMECGPGSFRSNARSDAVVASLGLQEDVVLPRSEAGRRYIVRNALLHPVPSSPRSLLTSPLLTARGKLRALADLLIPRRRSAEDESLASLVRRRLGPEVLAYVVDPLISGIHAGDPERMSSQYVLPALARFERAQGSILGGAVRAARAGGSPAATRQVMSFRHGMQQLPRAMAQRLGAAIRRRHAVTHVTRAGEGGGAWCIAGMHASAPFAVHASHVVVATTAHGLARVAWPDSVRRSLQRAMAVRYAPVATVTLGYARSQVSHPLDGFGALVPHQEGRDLLGVVFGSSTFEDRAPAHQVMLTAYLGGDRMRQLPSVPVLESTAHRELAALLGIRGEPLARATHAWDQGIPQFDVGHSGVLESLGQVASAHPGLHVIGSFAESVAVGDCLERGYATGAAIAASP